LAEIAKELSYGLMSTGYLKRVGNIFFRSGDSGCVQRDVVYFGSLRHQFNFELMNMDYGYFSGTKGHALALQEAFGGSAYPSEYTAIEKPVDLWIWESPDRENRKQEAINGTLQPLDFDTVKAVLFDEA